MTRKRHIACKAGGLWLAASKPQHVKSSLQGVFREYEKEIRISKYSFMGI